MDLEIIPKKGFFSKIKSLIFFVTNKNEKDGRFFSLSIDPKKYLEGNNTTHYKQVDSFTKENILEAAQAAKDLNTKDLNHSSICSVQNWCKGSKSSFPCPTKQGTLTTNKGGKK